MKLLCCNKLLLLLLLAYSTAFGGLTDKSAIVYYGKDISYPMVGIHDYVIVQPSHINTYTHGFELYKDKMYAYVSIGELDKNSAEYSKIKKSWILGENRAWKSSVLDLTNPEYKKFLFKKIIEVQMKRGFKNFFFDTLDSYQLVNKTQEEKERSRAALIDIIKTFHQRYPDSKLIINRGFEIIDSVHDAVNAVLFESYYSGIAGRHLSYKKVSNVNRKWLDSQLKKVRKYDLDIICVDYLSLEHLNADAPELIKKIKNKNMIPYISTKELTSYGKSSKNPIKREILTLVDKNKLIGANMYGALPLEYQGYIQKLYNIKEHPLPSLEEMQRYTGVVVWLSKPYKEPNKFIQWILDLQKYNIKVVFAEHITLPMDETLAKLSLEVKTPKLTTDTKMQVIHKDAIMGFEIDPLLFNNAYFINNKEGEALYTTKDSAKNISTLAAIMPWGGYAIENAFLVEMGDENLWAINPFKFFARALRLKKLAVPDTTTENGKRLLFSHIDGDGIMNRVEWNPKLFAGDIIYKEILKKYKMPISVSTIGAEVDDNGLYPKIAPQLQKIVKKMFRLPNVEPATHTFTHTFIWAKIINGNLDEKYRLKPKGYHFSLAYETTGMIDEINTKYLPKGKFPKAKTIFWSGDCVPTESVLAYVSKHKLLNINGGDTYITNNLPWLTNVAPIGIEKGGYYQIYTGEQNENIFTNDWLGPYWGFKKVVQTFKLTNSPRRLKPIDIYYHNYSGSKRASLNALKYVYNWALKQDVTPIFTSEYIPKAMDYYTVSMAYKNGSYLVDGMKDLKTLRLEDENVSVIFKESKNILGFKKFDNHTYIHIGNKEKAIVKLAKPIASKTPYLVSTNAKVKVKKFDEKNLSIELNSYLPIKLQLYIPKECRYKSSASASNISKKKNVISFTYKDKTKVGFNVTCR